MWGFRRHKEQHELAILGRDLREDLRGKELVGGLGHYYKRTMVPAEAQMHACMRACIHPHCQAGERYYDVANSCYDERHAALLGLHTETYHARCPVNAQWQVSSREAYCRSPEAHTVGWRRLYLTGGGLVTSQMRREGLPGRLRGVGERAISMG